MYFIMDEFLILLAGQISGLVDAQEDHVQSHLFPTQLVSVAYDTQRHTRTGGSSVAVGDDSHWPVWGRIAFYIRQLFFISVNHLFRSDIPLGESPLIS